MQSGRRILVIGDDPALHEELAEIFAQGGERGTGTAGAVFFGAGPGGASTSNFSVESAFRSKVGLGRVSAARAEGAPYALAFVELRWPPQGEGVEAIPHLCEADPELQVVLCATGPDCARAESFAQIGGCDRLVILKQPFARIEVLQMTRMLMARRELARRLAHERGAALDRSEGHFRIIAENVAEMVSVLDRTGAALYHSPSYEKALRLPPDELAGHGLLAHLHPDDQPLLARAVEKAAASGENESLDCRLRHGDGTWRMLEIHLNPVRRPQGAVEHLVLVARDITVQRREEEEHRQMEVQLRHAQKMQSIGQLASGIAHEINTPAQYIGDNTRFLQDAFADLQALLETYARMRVAAESSRVAPELIREAEAKAAAIDLDYLCAEVPKAIGQSLHGLGHISRIVGAMKEFSYPGTREKSATDLNRAIQSTITVSTHEWKYVATVTTDFAADLPDVPCLPGEFNQVILNLIVNASHAIAGKVGNGAAGKGVIAVTTRRDGDWAEICVSDTGCGIPEEIRDRIFEPFFTTWGVGKGTGQGLAIAHSVIVEKHRGRIEVESEPGTGTVFRLWLPLDPARLEKEAA